MTGWEAYATALAHEAAPGASRWHRPIACTPRHLFVPAWWQRGPGGWRRHDAECDLESVYKDASLVTRVGPAHADHATPGQVAAGRATSSSTQPSLLVKMNRHAMIDDGMDVLEIGTGSGYGTALLTARLGDAHVASVDVDPYLVDAAASRLRAAGHAPTLTVCDATEHVDGTYDRIISTVALRPIPPTLVKALRPGGRLVAVISGIRAVLAADRLEDGRLLGRIEHATAGFMNTRRGEDYEAVPVQPGLDEEGEVVGPGLYPLADPDVHWELASMLGVTHPGVATRWWEPGERGGAVCLLWDVDGSWARAEGRPGQVPLVHQAGPQRLWTILEGLKTQWLEDGGFPLYGAAALVELDGSVDLMRGTWRKKIAAPLEAP